MKVIHGLDELAGWVGKEVAVSDWEAITQERIDRFAEVTGDRQWVHVDVERARRESPYGGTIAHGFLTLSLLPLMLESSLRIDGLRMAVNYGLDRLRFTAPVPAGSRIRGRFVLASLTEVETVGPTLGRISRNIDGRLVR